MENLSLNVENQIATILLQRPPANALSTKVVEELSQTLDEIEQNDKVKVVVLHGEGRFFAAGADIKEFTTLEDGEKLAQKGQQVFDRMENFSKPIIAAIHGAALGGGLEIAMACHIRLATDDAKLGLPELQLGLIPGFAGTQRLPRLIGKAKALEMMLTSEPITGAEAKSLGLVNESYKDQSEMLEEAYKLAEKITAKSAYTIKLLMEAVNFTNDENFATGVAKEAELFGLAFASTDGKEGIQAFIDKRKPNFQNK